MAYFYPQTLLRPLQDVYLRLAVSSRGTVTQTELRGALGEAGVRLGEDVDLGATFEALDMKASGEGLCETTLETSEELKLQSKRVKSWKYTRNE